MSNKLQFKNGKFKIMQIADTQEIETVNPDTIKLITLALEKEKPDLVVFTGDQIKGYSPTFKFDTYRKIKRTIADILRPLEDRNIPFCITFGNHDNNCGISNADQIPIYSSHKNFIMGEPRSTDDQGTFSLQIKDSLGKKNIFNLYLIDSNQKGSDGFYTPVKMEQLEWYRNEREKIFIENGKYLPSIVFQHIPLPEYYNVLKRVKKGTKGAVEAFGSHANQFFVLPDEALKEGQFMYECPASPEINTGEFEAFKEKGEVLGICVGHDHNNSSRLNLDGIDLIYTQGSGFNVYGPGKKRGVRVIVLDEKCVESYDTYTVTMDELCDYKPTKPLLEFALSHSPSSVAEAKRDIKKLLTAAGAVTMAAIAVKKLCNKK